MHKDDLPNRYFKLILSSFGFRSFIKRKLSVKTHF